MNELKQKLENFRIFVSEGEDGQFTAYSVSEPFFCFVRPSLLDAEKIVRDTLESYVSNFYGVTDVRVSVTNAPVAAVSAKKIPRVPLKTVHEFLPSLSDGIGPTKGAMSHA